MTISQREGELLQLLVAHAQGPEVFEPAFNKVKPTAWEVGFLLTFVTSSRFMTEQEMVAGAEMLIESGAHNGL